MSSAVATHFRSSKGSLPIGLALSAGGARGAYQLGCWKAFLEHGLSFQAVAGSSIGALNGALVCQGDWESARRLWSEFTRAQVLGLDFGRIVKFAAVLAGDIGLLFLPVPKVRAARFVKYASSLAKFASRHGALGRLRRHGLLSIFGLRPLLMRHLDLGLVQRQPAPLFITACGPSRAFNPVGDPTWFRIQDCSEEEAWRILAASMSIPYVFAPVEMHGTRYSDGGLGQWLPLRPLYDNGVRRIVAVSTKAGIRVRPEDYPDGEVVLISPEKPLGRFPVATFRFTRHAVDAWTELGYRDASRVLEHESLAERWGAKA